MADATINEFLSASWTGLKQGSLNYLAGTPTGQDIQNEAISAKLKDIASNPVTWVIVVIAFLYLIRRK